MLWWDPDERIAWELEQLSGKGYEFQPPLVRTLPFTLVVDADIGGERQRLEVDFPELYPYFRFEVRAPHLSLPHHQHLLSKNLCLMPRGTEHWDMSKSLAWYLDTQLPKVVAAGRATESGPTTALEEPQAEPVTDYYTYRDNAMILIDGAWTLPADFVSGRLQVLSDQRVERTDPLRGTVMHVTTGNGDTVLTAPPHLQRGGEVVRGHIVQLQEPILEANPADLRARIKQEYFSGEQEERTSILALVMPEEHGWRDRSGQGWLFIVTEKNKGSYYARAGRAGATDLHARAPELNLSSATIAVFGLGCLGGISTIEFAKAGAGEVRFLDHDYLDPGTALRWYLGLQAVGVLKAHLIADFVKKHYPLTKPVPYEHRLGSFDNDRQTVEAIADGASLIYDATAEPGVSYFLAELARHRNLPFVHVSGTQGGWGGIVARLTPTTGCWYCFKAAEKAQQILPAPADPSGNIQPTGCANPTFTGAGFDLTTIAMTGVRTAVATLSEPYPNQPWDVMVIALRDEHGAMIPPRFSTYLLPKDPACVTCGSA